MTVKVENANDSGTVELSQIEPQVGRAVIATLTDADGGEVVSDWQWAEADEETDGTCPETGYTDITDATSATYSPVDVDVDTCLQATVTYRDSLSVAGTEGVRTASQATKRGVQDDAAANDAPKYEDQDPSTVGDQSDETSRTVAENTDADEPIGAPVGATDTDLLLYTLGGADADSFKINRETGQLSTKAKLDYETKATYMVIVTATDPSGATDSIIVTINVTDENDDATIAPVSYTHLTLPTKRIV